MFVAGKPVKLVVDNDVPAGMSGRGIAFGRTKLEQMWRNRLLDAIEHYVIEDCIAVRVSTHQTFGRIEVGYTQALYISGLSSDLAHEIWRSRSLLVPFKKLVDGALFAWKSIKRGYVMGPYGLTNYQVGGTGYTGVKVSVSVVVTTKLSTGESEAISGSYTTAAWGVSFFNDPEYEVPLPASDFRPVEVVRGDDRLPKWCASSGVFAGYDDWARNIVTPTVIADGTEYQLPFEAGHHHWLPMVVFMTPKNAVALVFCAETPKVGVTLPAKILQCRSMDGGKTWTREVATGLMNTLFPDYLPPDDPPTEATTGNYHLIRSSINRNIQYLVSGMKKVPIATNAVLFAATLISQDAQGQYAATIKIIRSTDGGVTYTVSNLGINLDGAARVMDIINVGRGVLLMKVSYGNQFPFDIDRPVVVVRSANYGQTWSICSFPLFMTQDVGMFSPIPSSGSDDVVSLPARTNSGYSHYISSDKGKTWKAAKYPTTDSTANDSGGIVFRMDEGGLTGDEWTIEANWSRVIDGSSKCPDPAVPWVTNSKLKGPHASGGVIIEP